MRLLAVSAAVAGLGLLTLCGCLRHGDSHETATHEKSHAPSSGEPIQSGDGHSEAKEGEAGHRHKIVVTSAARKDITSTQRYVCQIHSCQHIELRALEGGYLEKICVKEGQAVKKGDLLFKILPTLHQARLDTEIAEANRVQIELDNLNALLKKQYVSDQAIALKKAELAGAKAKVELARAELGFTKVTAPFDGIVDRQRNQLGSLINEGDILTTFSDNSKMWVYFNVPESRYLEYIAELERDVDDDPRQVKKVDDDGDRDDDSDDESDEDDRRELNQMNDDDDKDDADDEEDEEEHDDAADRDATAASGHLQIELRLANGKTFPQPGKIGAIEADFNNTTGNIPFRADFSNPKGLLRNGQTGTILIHNTLKDVVVIPQRATFEILAKRYAFVVDNDNVVHQRDITIHSAQDDIFVIEGGLETGDKIVFEGIRQVRDGDKIEYEFLAPEKVLGNLKYHAE